MCYTQYYRGLSTRARPIFARVTHAFFSELNAAHHFDVQSRTHIVIDLDLDSTGVQVDALSHTLTPY